MVDPVVSKLPAKSLDTALNPEGSKTVKTGDSKFDQVRARLIDEQAQRVEMPPEIKQVSVEQKKVLQADLAQRTESMGTRSPRELFGVDMKRAKEGIERLHNRVDALPKSSALEPFRKRLASIDAQYQSTGQLVNAPHATDSPADLMKIQLQVYQLTENLELMSKVVEQVTSGVKSIIQTQV